MRLASLLPVAQLEVAVLLVGVATWNIIQSATGPLARFVGYDFAHYIDAARRWADTGTPYLANEIRGPFQFSVDTFLHPPIALVLFAPFLTLPAILFWAIPLVGTGVLVASWRPARWAWPLMALQLNWPRFGGAVVFGNSDLWVMFLLALGLRFVWPLVFLVIKPSIAPIAVTVFAALALTSELSAARLRQLATAVALFVILTVPFGGLWLDWLAIVRNSPADPLYSVAAIPWLSLPAVAWVGRARGVAADAVAA